MKDAEFEKYESLRKRAVAIGDAMDFSAHGELVEMLKNPHAIVRKSAAGALVKLHGRLPRMAEGAYRQLMEAIREEQGEQVRQYMLRAMLPAAARLDALDLAVRPDFYLPEFDLYIEYWGMDTEEYVDNMRKKQFHYQLSRYVPNI